jgi:FAD:protein FMN transferase
MEVPAVSRRRLLALLGGGLAFAAIPRPLLHAASAIAGLQTATCTGRALGSELTLTVLHRDRQIAAQAGQAALAELQRLDALLSVYRTDSQVSILNREGRLAHPHRDLLEILRQSADVSQASEGAFDITVQPLWTLFAEARSAGRLPDEPSIQTARARVDYRRLRITDAAIDFAAPGMAITLNGIAQGFAADRATAILKSHGIEHALVNTGEVAPLGANPEGKPWTAGIQHPRQPDAYIALARLGNRCLATSGDYATTFSDDRRHNHIFDPATGDSPLDLSSVSIAAPTATLADALSTAVFVLGPDRGMKLLQHYANVDALLVRKDGTQLLTANFPRLS